MFKKLFSAFLAVCIVFALFTPNTAAAEEYPLWVGGVRVTSENLSGEAGEGSWTYVGDASSGTLTLDNATITGTYGPTSYGHYNIYFSDGLNLTIELKGENMVPTIVSFGSSNMTIEGPGSLSGDHLFCSGSLAILNGATVNEETSENNQPIFAEIGLTISDSNVSAISNFNSYAIYCNGSDSPLTISGNSVVSAQANSSYFSNIRAIQAGGGIFLNDGLSVVEPEGGYVGTTTIRDSSDEPAKSAVIRKVNTITLIAAPEGTGTVTGGGVCATGTEVTVAAEPAEGYSFVNWTENGQEVSTDSQYSFTITADRELVANFVPLHSLTAIANPSQGGAVTGGGAYVEGTEVTVTAVPNDGYRFVDWTENGQEVSTDSQYSFTITADRELVANFVPLHSIAVTATPTEGGTVAGDGVYEQGAEVTVIATPNDGYRFVNWTEGDQIVSTDAEYSFMSTKDRNLIANFVSLHSIKFVNYNGTELQSGTLAYGETPVYEGETPTKPADDKYTYTFTGWDPEIAPVTKDQVYTATYKAEPYPVNNTVSDEENPSTPDNEEKTQVSKIAYAPDTGDHSPISLWIVLLSVSLMGLIIISICGEKHTF